jgi:hypothetical protein
MLVNLVDNAVGKLGAPLESSRVILMLKLVSQHRAKMSFTLLHSLPFASIRSQTSDKLISKTVAIKKGTGRFVFIRQSAIKGFIKDALDNTAVSLRLTC